MSWIFLSFNPWYILAFKSFVLNIFLEKKIFFSADTSEYVAYQTEFKAWNKLITTVVGSILKNISLLNAPLIQTLDFWFLILKTLLSMKENSDI